MRLLVITTPEDDVSQELETCNLLLQNGIERLHIRKPNYSLDELTKFIERIDSKYWHKVSIHQHLELADQMNLGGKHYKSNATIALTEKFVSKSCHTVDEVNAVIQAIDYAFISPVFNSISKQGYKSQWTAERLQTLLGHVNKNKIVALGGIDIHNILELKCMGFEAAALLGCLWSASNKEDRLKKYLDIRHVSKQ